MNPPALGFISFFPILYKALSKIMQFSFGISVCLLFFSDLALTAFKVEMFVKFVGTFLFLFIFFNLSQHCSCLFFVDVDDDRMSGQACRASEQASDVLEPL